MSRFRWPSSSVDEALSVTRMVTIQPSSISPTHSGADTDAAPAGARPRGTVSLRSSDGAGRILSGVERRALRRRASVIANRLHVG